MLSLRSTGPGRPLIIAHRGASREAPENTLASFGLALRQEADLIEFDVQMSADGVPVVIHDPAVDRTTDGTGLVKDLTLAEIKALDAGLRAGPGFRGERVPTLDEVLGWSRGAVPVALEIKHDGPLYDPGVEAAVVEALRRHGLEDSAAVISFDHAAVLRIRQLCPRVACGVLFACTPVSPARLALEAGAEALLPHLGSLSAEMVADAHAHGLTVCPWVADEEPDMAWALSLGVDAVATNRPGRLAALMRRG